MALRRILIVGHTGLSGCLLLAHMVHAQGIENAKIEVVDELPEPKPIMFRSFPKYEMAVPDISLKDVCYPIGMGGKNSYKKEKQQQRYAANRHNYRKR